MSGGKGMATVKLPEILDMAAAEGLLETMRRHLDAGGPLSIDASAVERLTVPCLQILLAATRTHDQVTIDCPSAALVAAFADLGVEFPLPRADSLVGAPGPAQPPEPAADPVGDPAILLSSERNMAKRILTIDDSKTMRDMLRLTLVDAGFDVLQAVDGMDGLEVLDRETVDVVITDINMPRLDGYGVIKKLRSNPDFKTPILVLTTESEADKKNLGRESGATGWLVKPFDPDRLVATINKVSP